MADVRRGDLLRSGRADFGSLMLSTALDEYAGGPPPAHLVQFVHRSHFLLMAWRNPREGPPVQKLSDLNGRKVTLWLADFRTPYLAIPCSAAS